MPNKVYEKRIIERIVRVFQVEARNQEHAEELYQSADWRDLEVESYPIDAEETDPWIEISGESNA